MTRQYSGLVHCPHCGRSHTEETAFERWMRNHHGLRSEDGIVRFDCDVLLHKYMMVSDKRSSRLIQCLMFIEVKTHSAGTTLAQRDTLSLFSQVLRNRRRNMHGDKKGLHATDHTPLTVAWSRLNKRNIRLRMFGGHLLQLSGTDPENSAHIAWDKKPIDLGMLVQLLRFEIDPDTLGVFDWRRRYSSFNGRRQQKVIWTT